MESFVLDMLGLLFRWLHMIVGIAWVGASFYFIWLDNNLREPPKWKQDKGIKGDLWSFHGGGIYEVAKYKAGPEKMPKTLHWFYWEAYSTWITGMCLMFVIYYFQASTYLVPVDGWLTDPYAVIAASICFIVSGVAIYELLIRSKLADQPLAFAVALTLVLSVYSWLSYQLFSGRAAYIHMGVLVGSIMAANVFIGIIPPQREFVRAIESETELPLQGLQMAKLRSTHNNYLTLPVLFCMISNHYPVLYGHRHGWLILMAIFVIAAGARQFFNLKHKGIHKPQILATCFVLFIVLSFAIGWDKYKQQEALASLTVPTETALPIAAEHCSVCHASEPSFPGMLAPPAGMILVSEQDFSLHAASAMDAISTDYMPLGNITGMTSEERETLLGWLNQF